MKEDIMKNLKISEETIPVILQLGELLPGGFCI